MEKPFEDKLFLLSTKPHSLFIEFLDSWLEPFESTASKVKKQKNKKTKKTNRFCGFQQMRISLLEYINDMQ